MTCDAVFCEQGLSGVDLISRSCKCPFIVEDIPDLAVAQGLTPGRHGCPRDTVADRLKELGGLFVAHELHVRKIGCARKAGTIPRLTVTRGAIGGENRHPALSRGHLHGKDPLRRWSSCGLDYLGCWFHCFAIVVGKGPDIVDQCPDLIVGKVRSPGGHGRSFYAVGDLFKELGRVFVGHELLVGKIGRALKARTVPGFAMTADTVLRKQVPSLRDLIGG